MIKDINGKLFDEYSRDALTIDKNDVYRKVIVVGEEGVGFSLPCTNKKHAENTITPGNKYSQYIIDQYKICIVQYRLLPITDENGHDIRVNDEVKYNGNIYIALNVISNKNGGRENILVFNEHGSWCINPSHLFTFHSRPTNDIITEITIESGSSILTALKNGKGVHITDKHNGKRYVVKKEISNERYIIEEDK